MKTSAGIIGTGLWALSLSACGAQDAEPQTQRVVMETDAGRIVIEVDVGRAPLTACNFLNYAPDGANDGGSF